MFKKSFLCIISVSLIIFITSYSISSDIKAEVQNQNVDIYAEYIPVPDPEILYSVDITWGKMDFNYSTNDSQQWNPNTHNYDMTHGTPTWTCSDNADLITISNHSNSPVTATLSYSSKNGTAVKGEFSKSKIDLLAPVVGSSPSQAPTAITSLSLSGILPKFAATNSPVGAVTLTVDSAIASGGIPTDYIKGEYNSFCTTPNHNVFKAEGKRGKQGFVTGTSGTAISNSWVVPASGLMINNIPYYIETNDKELVVGTTSKFALTETDTGLTNFSLPTANTNMSYSYTIIINAINLTGTVSIVPVN